MPSILPPASPGTCCPIWVTSSPSRPAPHSQHSQVMRSEEGGCPHLVTGSTGQWLRPGTVTGTGSPSEHCDLPHSAFAPSGWVATFVKKKLSIGKPAQDEVVC